MKLGNQLLSFSHSMTGVAVALCAVFLSSCGKTKLGSNVSDTTTRSSDALENQPSIIKRDIKNSGAEFQVKTVELLSASIKTCLGEDVTKITAEMFLPPAGQQLPELGEGKVRFLTPGGFKAGDDIVQAQSEKLMGRSRGTWASTRMDSLTDVYLLSLGTIADVVAHNCDLNSEKCKCGTPEEARAMFDRCLPNLDPKKAEVAKAIESLSKSCSSADMKVKRNSIAALISSYAFAAAR